MWKQASSSESKPRKLIAPERPNLAGSTLKHDDFLQSLHDGQKQKKIFSSEDHALSPCDKIVLSSIFSDGAQMLEVLKSADSKEMVYKYGYEEMLLQTYDVVNRQKDKSNNNSNNNNKNTNDQTQKNSQKQQQQHNHKHSKPHKHAFGWSKLINLSKLADVVKEREKIDKDRAFLADLMLEVATSFPTKGDWSPMKNCIQAEHERLAKELQSVREERDNWALRKALYAQINDISKQHHTQVEHLRKQSAIAKDQLQQLRSSTKADYNYCSKISAAKQSFTEFQQAQDEKNARVQLEQIILQYEEECLFHQQLQSFYAKRSKQATQQQHYWSNRLEQDNDDINKKLEVLAEQARDNFKLLEQAVDKWKQYKQVFNEDEEEERIEAERQRERYLQIIAAIRIQAWWRGVLIRRRLAGKSSKKKGKKGKSKKKKGKKGKSKSRSKGKKR